MNNNDERDYAEEAYNRAELERADDEVALAGGAALLAAGAELVHKGRVLVERLTERMAEADPDGEAEWNRQREQLLQRIAGWHAAGQVCVHGRPLPLAFCCARPQVVFLPSAAACPEMPPAASRNPLVQVAEVVAWLKDLWTSNPDFDRQCVLEQVQARLTALVEGEL